MQVAPEAVGEPPAEDGLGEAGQAAVLELDVVAEDRTAGAVGMHAAPAVDRPAGPPFQLTPTDLARHQMMTSGGMTSAIDRLERKGLVTRTPNPSDRRGSLIGLSEEGLRTVDDAMGLHVAEEHRLLDGLDEAERAQLEALLRRLLRSIDT